MYPYSLEKCQCGIDKVDETLPHSDYCPKYRKITERECDCSGIKTEDRWHSVGCPNRGPEKKDVDKSV